MPTVRWALPRDGAYALTFVDRTGLQVPEEDVDICLRGVSLDRRTRR
jgi:hypothetical protein